MKFGRAPATRIIFFKVCEKENLKAAQRYDIFHIVSDSQHLPNFTTLLRN
jgi:hypothetical protein